MLVILMGSLPMSLGTSIELILSSTSLSWLFQNSFKSVHTLNIFFEVPRKRLCIGSTVQNLITSKFSSSSKTLVADATVLFHLIVLCLCFALGTFSTEGFLDGYSDLDRTGTGDTRLLPCESPRK